MVLVMRALGVSAAFYEYRARLGSREKHALTSGVVVKVARRRAGPLDVGGD